MLPLADERHTALKRRNESNHRRDLAWSGIALWLQSVNWLVSGMPIRLGGSAFAKASDDSEVRFQLAPTCARFVNLSFEISLLVNYA